jgi:hypothetical protein
MDTLSKIVLGFLAVITTFLIYENNQLKENIREVEFQTRSSEIDIMEINARFDIMEEYNKIDGEIIESFNKSINTNEARGIRNTKTISELENSIIDVCLEMDIIC